MVSADGRLLRLVPREAEPSITAWSGPFRIVVQAVHSRRSFATGVSDCQLDLLVHWEPRYPVYRLVTAPEITEARDSLGRKLTASEHKSYQYPAAAAAEMTVHLQGVQRAAQAIAQLKGSFRVTMTNRLLSISWVKAPGGASVAQTVDGLEFTWKTLRYNTALRNWEVELEWVYPANHPHFDSFEESKWLRDVQIHWRTAEGKLVRPRGEEIYASGRRVYASCLFPEGIDPQSKGWTLVLTTPAPLREADVPFLLRDIPLP
jgi:hypothetical protein